MAPGNGQAALDKLDHRDAVAAGSPLHPDETVLRPDTSVTTRCEQCRATFVGIGDRTAADNLARHMTKHTTTTSVDVVDALLGKIADGELKPGQALKLAVLTDELGVTRATIRSAVDELVEADVLRWWPLANAHNRRVLVA